LSGSGEFGLYYHHRHKTILMKQKKLSPDEIMDDQVRRGLINENISPEDLEPRFEVANQIANEIIPMLPRLGAFLTQKSKVATYNKTKEIIHTICRKKQLDKKHDEAVAFILLNRSKVYSRALDAHLDSISDEVVYPEGRLKEWWPYFTGLVLVGIIMFAHGYFNDLQRLAGYISMWLILLFVAFIAS
jgi:hypothetical protein